MLYCFRRPDTGKLINAMLSYEKFVSFREDADHLWFDDESGQPVEPESEGAFRAKRDWMEEAPGVPSDSAWPMHSYALGVRPEQRMEAQEHSRDIGVPTEFDRKGDAVFRNRKHRKRYCKAAGFFDRDAGYGDAAPDNL